MGYGKMLRLAAAGFTLALAGQAQAAEGAPVARAAAYGDLVTLPDWSGVWTPDLSSLFGPNGRPTPKLLPDAQVDYDAFLAAKDDGLNVQGPAANCVPTGMPGIMLQPYPIEFVYSPGRVSILIETYSQIRRIYTDGRPLPEDPEEWFNGTSIGHWNGDTLVVETAGFSPMTEITSGIPHGPNMRIVERIHLSSPERMVFDVSITDPDVIDGSFSYSQAYDLKADWEMREYVCQENNRDAADSDGRATMDLGFDVFGPLEDEGETKDVGDGEQ